MRRFAVAALALAAGCDSGYSVQIDVERACLPVSAAEIDVTVTAKPSGAVATQTVKNPDSSFASHRIVIVPPDGVTSLTVGGVARDALGGTIGSGSVTVAVSGHQLAMATLTITGASCGDGGTDGCSGEGGCSCATDLECGGATPRCDPASNRCVVCLPMNDNCTFGNVCVKSAGQYVCALGCKTDVDCLAVDAGAGGGKCCNQVCVDVSADPANCGMCGHLCAATEGCCAGMCHDVTADATNCGACGTVCNLANASSVCVARACTVGMCSIGYHDCDATSADGCESNQAVDPANCGGCAMGCSANHATPHCTAAKCDGPCDKGYLDCNADLRGDGCEISANTDPANCGGCATVCSNNHITVPACANGVCSGMCDAGYSDCNGNKHTDGCEINTASDPAHCGFCNRVCASGICTNGDCVRRIFVSSVLYNGGSLGSLAGADTACQGLATNAMLTGTYHAWLSDGVTNASARTTHSLAGYELVNGTKVAASYVQLTAGALLHPINATESAQAPPAATANCVTPGTAFVWTNTSANGVKFGTSCQNWMSALNADTSSGGNPNALDATWSNLGCLTPCDLTGSVYCIEQ